MLYKSTFYKSTFYKIIDLLQIDLLQIYVWQIHLLQIHSMFYKFTPCFTNPVQSTPVHVLQDAVKNLVKRPSIWYNKEHSDLYVLK